MKKTVIIVVAILAFLFLARNFVVKTIVQAAVRPIVGIGLNMGKLNIDIFNSLIHIKDMKVYNPGGFKDKVMVNIPEVYIDYNLGDILTGNMHLEEIRFHLQEFAVVTNKDGDVNINEIKIIKDQKKKKDGDKSKKKAPAPKQDVQIDNLSLKVEKVTYKDYSKGDDPKVKEFNINLDEQHENIKSLNAVVGLIIFKTMAKTSLASLTSVDLGGLQDTFSGGIGMATETLGEAGDKAKEALGSAEDSLKDATDNLKGLLKRSPFGK